MKFASMIVALLLFSTAGFTSEVKLTYPKPDNRDLLLPANYRDWVKLSPFAAGMPVHRHSHVANKLYVEPAAFERFTKTGKWPNKTVIVMELLSGNNGRTQQTEIVGLEAAVKNEGQFTEPWSYYGILFDSSREKSAAAKSDEQLDSVLAMAFPTLRSVTNATLSAMPPTMF